MRLRRGLCDVTGVLISGTESENISLDLKLQHMSYYDATTNDVRRLHKETDCTLQIIGNFVSTDRLTTVDDPKYAIPRDICTRQTLQRDKV